LNKTCFAEKKKNVQASFELAETFLVENSTGTLYGLAVWDKRLPVGNSGKKRFFFGSG
jgi:hypothetical protein